MLSAVNPPGHLVLACRGFTQATLGIEIVSGAGSVGEELLTAIRYVGPLVLLDKTIKFVLVEMAGEPDCDEMRKIAECAKDSDIFGKLFLICPYNSESSYRVMSDLQQIGLQVLLGRVGGQIPLGELVRHASHGFVIDSNLIAEAAGDPYAASILEAITGLARNLGLRTFASRVSGRAALTLLQGAGVDYVSVNPYGVSQALASAEIACC